MASSTNLQFPYLAAAQAQKHVTVNESLRLLDALVRTRVVEQGLTTPPATPDDGTVYIPGSGATGAWDTWDFNLAYYVDGAWRKIVPKIGWLIYDIDEDAFFKFEGDPTYWVEFSSGSGGGGGGSSRELLTAARTYYVRTDGDDGNDGLADSSGGAFLTLQKAIDTVAALDLSIYDVTIDVGNGTYTAGVTLKTLVGAGMCIILGDTTTPSNVLLNLTSDHGFDGIFTGRYQVKGVKCQTATSGNVVNVSGKGAVVDLFEVEVGAIATSAFVAARGAIVTFNANWAITGNIGSRCMQATQAGAFVGAAASHICTITGTLTVGIFAQAEELAELRGANITFVVVDTVTGTRYSAQALGLIQTNGGGASFFPGSVAGSTATGGQYV